MLQVFQSNFLNRLVRGMARNNSLYKVLNVAEKNDAAKRISDLLSGHQFHWREGFSKFNKIYEFQHYMLGQTCEMTMTSLSGHLLNYEFVGSYRKWKLEKNLTILFSNEDRKQLRFLLSQRYRGVEAPLYQIGPLDKRTTKTLQKRVNKRTSCHPGSLFDAEVEKQVTENMINIKRTLEKEIQKCQALIVWTDCDREGENIGFEIIDICQNVKPNVSIYRAKFSEITDRSVRQACQNLAQPDKRVSDAVDARQELDLRIGAAFTRFQTLRLQKVFPQVLSDKLISYGSCQFPTLGFVVERYKAREQFQSEPFWKIEVSHATREEGDDPMRTSFSWKRNRLFDELACQVLYANCVEPPAIATVTDVHSRPRSRWRPVALDTVELEKLSSRKLRINAKEVMKVAEKLYTQGYISYPRTETNIFPKDIDVRKLVQEQVQHPSWGGFAQRLLDLEGGPTPRNGRKTDKAHPPIHPTKLNANLSGVEASVYELIVRHFLACCHRDAQGHETTVEIELGAEKFSAQGLMIIAKNYLEVYIYDKWNAKVIPVYEVGDEFEPSSIEMVSGSTTAPPLLTEADLIALMDKHGIGTDATHAEHIETIKQRMYVGLTSDQRFLPGELGMGLVEGYNLMGYEMSRPELRAELEADLRNICDGRATKDQVLQRHISKYRSVFMEAVAKAEKLDQALATYFGSSTQIESNVLNPSQVSTPIRPCPSCGKDMVLKRKKDGGFMISCMGYPNCTMAAFLPKSVLSVSVHDSVCPTCQPRPVHRVRLKLNRSSVPQYFDCDQTACIGGCDEDINNILGIKFKSNRPPTSSNVPQHRRPLAPANRGNPSGAPGFLGGANRSRHGGPRGGGSKAPSSGKRKMSSSSSTRMPSKNTRSDFASEGDSTPNCNCGLMAAKLTVRKEGPNTGRDFYKCPNSSGNCNFFVWADAPPSRRPHTASTSHMDNSSNNRPVPTRPRAHSAPSSGSINCRCNIAAVERTVQKEGANKGRSFHTCSKPRGEQCGFFEWKDSNPAGSRSYSTSSANQNHHQSSNQTETFARPRVRKPPTCGLCKQVGHTRRGCPNK